MGSVTLGDIGQPLPAPQLPVYVDDVVTFFQCVAKGGDRLRGRIEAKVPLIADNANG